MFVDAKGESIIVEGDSTLHNNSKFSVCTNFTKSATALENISCERYKKANSLAESKLYEGKELTRNILNETKQSSPYGATMYSKFMTSRTCRYRSIYFTILRMKLSFQLSHWWSEIQLS